MGLRKTQFKQQNVIHLKIYNMFESIEGFVIDIRFLLNNVSVTNDETEEFNTGPEPETTRRLHQL